MERVVDWFGTISRRKFVIAFFATMGLSVAESDADDDLSGVEDELSILAATIDQTNLADPQNLDSVIVEIERTVAGAQSTLDRGRIKDARAFSELGFGAEIIAGNSRSQPLIEARISAIQISLNYYSTLNRTLSSAYSVRESLKSAEDAVFFAEEAQQNLLPEDHADVTFLKTGPGLEPPIGEEVLEEVSAATTKLLPDVQIVLDEMRRQETIYNLIAASQIAYFEATGRIESGAILREESEFQNARSKFEQAQLSVAIEIPPEHRNFSLESSSFTLNQYHEVLDKYQTAASLMLESCNADADTRDANRQFSDGLDLLLETRKLVDDNLSPFFP